MTFWGRGEKGIHITFWSGQEGRRLKERGRPKKRMRHLSDISGYRGKKGRGSKRKYAKKGEASRLVVELGKGNQEWREKRTEKKKVGSSSTRKRPARLKSEIVQRRKKKRMIETVEADGRKDREPRGKKKKNRLERWPDFSKKSANVPRRKLEEKERCTR